MELTVWDHILGATRAATQQDIDILQAKADAYGRMIHESRAIEFSLSEKVGQINDRARMAKLGDISA